MYFRLTVAATLASAVLSGAAQAAPCPGRPDALGTSRVIALDPAQYQRLGLMQYRQTLPLEDHEVVLTFDDGPLPPHTSKVLDALAAQCVKATFFVVGQMAKTYPALVRREYREGHTIGTHTEHHPYMARLSDDAAEKEITDGIAAANKAIGIPASAPFFRFPYFSAPRSKEAIAVSLGLTIFSTDVHASDWQRISPERVAANAIARLERRKKGILLLHDIHERTALALPLLLSELKKRGYRVVQVVPATNAKATASRYQSKIAN